MTSQVQRLPKGVRKCDFCPRTFECGFGGILIGLPQGRDVKKYHLCPDCTYDMESKSN